ncbi:MAG: hypothetical protein HY655_11775 [Acidobacteria bacterium]|nr:hypothetical protein [Acidobacteriota bacterium]
MNGAFNESGRFVAQLVGNLTERLRARDKTGGTVKLFFRGYPVDLGHTLDPGAICLPPPIR